MALIKCTDCNKEVSDKAQACIYCGCPLKSTPNDVLIHFAKTNASQLIFQNCVIYDSKTGKKLAEGRQNQTLSFQTNEPIEIYLKVANYSKSKSFITYPGDRYNVRYSFWSKLIIEKVDLITVGDNTSNFNI